MEESREKQVWRIRISAPDEEALRKYLKDHPLYVKAPKRQPDGSISIEAYVSPESLKRIQETGWDVEVLEDHTKVCRERQQEVGRGDRFEGGTIVPRGLGRKE